ncbi:MgtC/SapB family protein [Halosquirtibacter xylanolyticus]|uniref:MgtC/SapB family protein n=1 Tax=Halosquirtibacter xylanolyticus TaxID=3374599 RepID=UPI0037488C49|nr:MgtC/SapB family protein [Prolixibacteraceae bacterium]
MITAQEITLTDMALRVTISMLMGLSIGIEREANRQPAGLRTHTLICVGATLIMLVSIYIPQMYHKIYDLDPTRIAAQVVTGIGFVGAGAIIKMGTNIRGLTTAATIWSTGAIGLAIGAGMYEIAWITTAIILFVLILFNIAERKLFAPSPLKKVIVESHKKEDLEKTIINHLKSKKIRIRSSNMDIRYEPYAITYDLLVHFNSRADLYHLQNSLKELDPTITHIRIFEV